MKFRNCMTSLALALSVMIALPGPASASAAVFESQVFQSTNKQRVAHDRVKLKSGACIDGYADKWAKWMATNHKLKHQSMSTIMSKCDLKLVGENIAYGYTSGSATVAAWMKSSGHKKNILKSGYRLIGIGAYKDDDGRWWVSQVFGTKS